MRASRRQDSTPRPNSATNRKHSAGFVQHDQVQRESEQASVDRGARNQEQPLPGLRGATQLPADEPRPISVGQFALFDDRSTGLRFDESPLCPHRHIERREL